MPDTLNDVVPASGMVVIADLEYTSWEGAQESGWAAPGQFREIVQIGAVRVDAGDHFSECADFSMLVRPTINPELSNYFTALTGITNESVARDGVGLAEALTAFAGFVRGDIVLSHGRDELVIGEDCALKELDNPFASADWRDINPPIRRVTDEHLMSSELPAFFGLDPVGPAHDALADARALAKVLAHLRNEDRD
ncbi:MAG: exonuclease domain-containing protein [Alphaproteobacteria bacterium]